MTLVWSFLLAFSPVRVSIAVSPSVLFVGQTIRVTCTVPRDPSNRTLTIAIPGVTSSTRQLDGVNALITHTLTVPHVPCDTSAAVCVVENVRGQTFLAMRSFFVAGCNL